MPAATRLDISALPAVIDVMVDAFQDYPVMHFVIGPAGDVHARLRRVVELFVTRRVRRGGPLLGVHDPASGVLAGAVAMTLPSEPEPPADLGVWVETVWQDLGPDAFERYQHYASMWPQLEATPHHHLNMIGVARTHAGRGYGRALLDAVHQMAADDPESSGVSLTTELARNVDLYEHVGYHVVGRKTVAPGFETWGLFRPSRVT
ncbi:MAG: hypothetical protein AMXMBFR57_12580 [Acidimicrobiia bacterium]